MGIVSSTGRMAVIHPYQSKLKYPLAIIGSMAAAFVLVHGTGHGGWCWRFIAPMLRAAGHDVYGPTLTGLGASSHLLHELNNRVWLDTHVKDVTNLLS